MGKEALLIPLIKALGGGGAVDDVQINGTSIVQDGVANVPVATQNSIGVVKAPGTFGVSVWGGSSAGTLALNPATEYQSKSGSSTYNPIVPSVQHASTFYGLAKAAGADMKDISSTTVGTYTENAKDAIMAMLGVFDLIAPHEGAQAANAYSIGQCFIFAGKLCKATAAIAVGDAIVVGTNCQQTTLMAEINA